MAESQVARMRRRVEDARNAARYAAEKGVYDVTDINQACEWLHQAVSHMEEARVLGEYAIDEGWGETDGD